MSKLSTATSSVFLRGLIATIRSVVPPEAERGVGGTDREKEEEEEEVKEEEEGEEITAPKEERFKDEVELFEEGNENADERLLLLLL